MGFIIRNAHHSVVIARDFFVGAHFDSVVVVVPVVSRFSSQVVTEPQVVCHGHELQGLVAAAMVKVCVPARGRNASNLLARLWVNVVKALPVSRHLKKHPDVEVRAAEPQPVVLDKREDVLVSDRIGVPDDQELLAVLHELGDVLAEEGEGRVGDDDVRLFQVRDALGAAEVAAGVLFVAMQRDPGGLVALEEKLDVGHVRRAVAVLVFHMIEDDGERPGLLAFAIARVVFREQGELARDGRAVVAGGDEPFEAELVEVGGEVLEEVALEGIVAVAVDDLAAEGVGVELEVSLNLFLDVDILGVELVLLGRLRGAQALVQGFAFHGGIGLLEFA